MINVKRMATLVVAFSITGALHAMLSPKRAVNDATLATTWCAPLPKPKGFPAAGCVAFAVSSITDQNPLIITPGLDKKFNKTANTAKLKEVYGYYFVQDGKTFNHRLLSFDAAVTPQDVVVCLMGNTDSGVQIDALKKLATEKGLTLTAGYEGKQGPNGALDTKNCFVLTNAGSTIATGLGGSISPLQKKFTSTQIVTPAQPARPARPAVAAVPEKCTPAVQAQPAQPAQPARPAVLFSTETPYIYPTP